MNRITVIIPVYNSMRTLPRLLESILQQTYPAAEIIVSDNGSDDGTEAYVRNLAMPHVRYVDMPTSSRTIKKNESAQLASGEYVVFIDSDMVLEPDVLKECVEEMAGGHVCVVIPERSFGKGFWAKCKRLERDCYIGDPLIEAARFTKKDRFRAIGGYDPTMIAGEDMDLHNRLLLHGTCGRTRSLIHHDEGKLSLRGTVSKKGYYGGTFAPYRARYPELAARQFGWRRLLRFARHAGRFARHPILAVGMFVMKGCEYLAFRRAEQSTRR